MGLGIVKVGDWDFFECGTVFNWYCDSGGYRTAYLKSGSSGTVYGYFE